MSYDPTERAQQPPAQQPYGSPPTPQFPAQPSFEQVPPTQLAGGTPSPYGQSNPGLPPYGQGQQQPGQQPYGQNNPNLPPYGQQQPGQQPYGQSNPNLPPYGQGQPGQQPYGQNNPNLPPYGQGQQQPGQSPYGQPSAYGQSEGYPASAPTDPYAPPPAGAYTPQVGQPWGVPPVLPPPVQQKPQSNLNILIIVLVIVVLVAGGGGTAFYFLTRPNPTISVKSDYTFNSTPAGASGTQFTLSGQNFSHSSTITFLLDGSPVLGGQTAQSDSSGNLPSTTLMVTDSWSVGNHTLTAKDASGYTTKTGMSIVIVTPGQAHTPGPHGAPSDDASGTISLTIAGTDQRTLTVKGSSNGGTVCGQGDDGQPHTVTGTSNGVGYVETIVETCSGTYKGGKLDYTETDTSDTFIFNDGVRCTVSTPYVNTHLVGTFSSPTQIGGDASSESTTLTCSLNGVSQSSSVNAQQASWSGVADMR
jgi:hypothetical protein